MQVLLRMFVFLALVLPTAAWSFGNCTNSAYVALFPGSFTDAECEERADFRLRHGLGTSSVRVVSITTNAHGDDSAWIARVERNLAAIGTAMQSMGDVGTEDITILLAAGEAIEEWEAEAVPLVDDDGYSLHECGITVYKIPEGYNERHFDFLLAHEIFHCAQDRSFPAARVAGGDWWVEGSAEHFAHMAVPDAGDFGWYQSFDNRTMTEPLTALAYANVVLFHWLQQERGPEGLAAALAALPSGDDAAALRSVMDTEALAAFTRAFLKGEIRSPGGAAVPAAAYFTGFYNISEDADLPLSITPFVLQRYKLQFEKERHFQVELTGADGADVQMEDEGGAFAALPQKVSTCPDTVTRLAYAVSADGASNGEIQFTQDGNAGPGACCLEGEWTPTPETLAGLASFGNAVGGPAVAMAGGDLSCEYKSGDAMLAFRADGSGALSFDTHTTACVATMHGQSMKMNAARSGSFGFDWTAEDETKGMATYTDNSVGWTITLHIGPVAQTMSEADAGPSTEANGFAYTCTPTTLEIQGIYGLSHLENRFTRPPPPPTP